MENLVNHPLEFSFLLLCWTLSQVVRHFLKKDRENNKKKKKKK